MRLLKLVSLLFILVLAGCASSEASKERIAKYTFPELEQVNSIDNFRMDGWESIDRYSLILTSRPRQSYLLILGGGLNDLNFAQGLLVTSTLGKVEVGFDSVSTVQDPMMKAQIKRIYKLENKEQKNAIKAKIEAFADEN
ncbi:DUF6491 family protein [uncultured Shewanella sp.]|uniref:DUF6491 family protein n=1 Tax=uncultured Shewanella sp. TaxID=173975 RepID=UPI00260200DF|nr:DUF6491 family protein [uncultured Shewanella sp.]